MGVVDRWRSWRYGPLFTADDYPSSSRWWIARSTVTVTTVCEAIAAAARQYETAVPSGAGEEEIVVVRADVHGTLRDPVDLAALTAWDWRSTTIGIGRAMGPDSEPAQWRDFTSVYVQIAPDHAYIQAIRTSECDSPQRLQRAIDAFCGALEIDAERMPLPGTTAQLLRPVPSAVLVALWAWTMAALTPALPVWFLSGAITLVGGIVMWRETARWTGRQGDRMGLIVSMEPREKVLADRLNRRAARSEHRKAALIVGPIAAALGAVLGAALLRVLNLD